MPTDIQLSIEFGVSILQKIVDTGYDFLKKEQQRRDLFGKSTERYVQGLIDRFGEVKVLGMNSSMLGIFSLGQKQFFFSSNF